MKRFEAAGLAVLVLVAVLLIPAAQLAQFRDPVTGTAFACVAKPDGFELQSTFKRRGQPVTMSFTRPK